MATIYLQFLLKLQGANIVKLKLIGKISARSILNFVPLQHSLQTGHKYGNEKGELAIEPLIKNRC